MRKIMREDEMPRVSCVEEGPSPGTVNSILPHYARQIGKIFNYTMLNIRLYHSKLQFCIGDVTLSSKLRLDKIIFIYLENHSSWITSWIKCQTEHNILLCAVLQYTFIRLVTPQATIVVATIFNSFGTCLLRCWNH